MAMVGLTFGGSGSSPSPQNPLQDAIKILNLQLPQNLGTGNPSGVTGQQPTAIGGLGSANGSANSALMMLLKALMGAPGALGGLGVPSGPAPASVIFKGGGQGQGQAAGLGGIPGASDPSAGFPDTGTEQQGV